MIIDCASNPYDIRPAVEAIMIRFNTLAASGPVIGLFGECHDNPLHRLVQAVFLTSLPKSQAIFCVEQKEDFGVIAFNKFYERETPISAERFAEADPQGNILLALMSQHINASYAPHSFHLLLQTLMRQESVDFACTDLKSHERDELGYVITPDIVKISNKRMGATSGQDRHGIWCRVSTDGQGAHAWFSCFVFAL